jgi:hypothetical protein
MAKKAAKKAVKKAAGKKAGKPAKKSAKKPAAKGLAPVRSIGTGKGATVLDLGKDFVQMFNAGTADHKIWDALFAKNWVSIEGFGVGMLFDGRKAVEAKCAEWVASHEIHGASCEGPYCGSTGFAVKLNMDVTDKNSGQRMVMQEIAFYTVQGGKIIQEEFCYGM